jgi:hypothetical protein
MTVVRLLLLSLLVFAGVARAWQKGANLQDSSLYVRNKYIVQVDGDSTTLLKRGLTPTKVSL